MKKKTLALALSLALCLGLAAPVRAAEYPQVNWLPEGVAVERNLEIGELDSCRNGVVVACTGSWESQDQRYGLADRTGKLVVPIEYDYFNFISDNLICGTKDRTSYLIHKNTWTVTPLEYYPMAGEAEGLIEAYSYSWEPDYIHKYGFIDTTGNLVVPLVYDNASPFSEGLAVVSSGEWGSAGYAFVDRTGQVVLDLGTTYLSVESFSEGLAVVCGKDGKMGAIDRSGQLVIPLEYNRLDRFSNGLAAAAKEAGQDAQGNPIYAAGFIDKTGAVAIPFEYSMTSSFSDGLAEVMVHSGYELDEYTDTYVETYKHGLVDTAGNIVVPPVYDWLSGFETSQNGAAVVGRDGKYGLIDRTGAIVVPLEYEDWFDYARYNYFADGVAQLCKGDWETGKSYVMDSSGNLVIPTEYDFMWRSPKYGEPGVFFDGVAAVGQNGKWGYMDRSGKILLPLEYDEVSYSSGGVGVVRQGSRYGIVDLSAALTPAPAPTASAMPTNDALTADGFLQNPTVYKINGSNYFKIRDLAAILNGTGKQFSVGYNEELNSVTITAGEGYTKLPTDLAGAPEGGAKAAQLSNDAIYIDGVKTEVEVYKIDGGNYFKLRDLGKALDFYVGYNEARGMFILTRQSYSE